MPTHDESLNRATCLPGGRRDPVLGPVPACVETGLSPGGSSSDFAMSNRRRHLLRLLLILCVVSLSVYVFPMARFDDVLSRLAPWRWLEMVALYFGAMLLLFFPSYRFLARAGYRLGFFGFTAVMMASQAVNLVSPLRMGFPLRVYLFQKRYNVPVSTGTLLVPVEMFMGILVSSGLAFGFGAWWKAAVGRSAMEALLGAAGALALAAYWLAHRAATGGRLTPFGTPRRAAALVESLRPTLSQISLGMLLLFVLFYGMSTILGAGILQIAAGATGFEKPLGWLIGAWAAAYVMGVLSLLPQGIGLRDASLGWILHLGGADAGQAAAIVLLMRVVMTGFPLLAGLLAWAGLGISPARFSGTKDDHQGRSR